MAKYDKVRVFKASYDFFNKLIVNVSKQLTGWQKSLKELTVPGRHADIIV